MKVFEEPPKNHKFMSCFKSSQCHKFMGIETTRKCMSILSG